MKNKTKIFFDNDFSVTKVVHLLPFVEKNGIPHISNAGKMALKQILFFPFVNTKKKKNWEKIQKGGNGRSREFRVHYQRRGSVIARQKLTGT